jgi:hypothetical protein
MRPLGLGERRGTFSFTSNATNSPHAVSLNGVGCRPFMMGGNRGSGSPSSCAP